MKKIRTVLVFVLTLACTGLFAQNVQISGLVTDVNGEGIPFASIQVKGTSTGVSTDADGAYKISAPSKATLIFSSIGYKSEEVAVNGRAKIDVTLSPDKEMIEETVVVAYGTAKKESLTGAVASISSKDLEKRPVTSAISALEGSTPGVQINNTNGEPGSTPNIRIRGYSTINGDNSPLYVVDGIPMTGSSVDINANDIESISILKDAASSALYGNRASNGVILITTKKGTSEKIRIRATINQGIYTRGLNEYEKVDADQFMELYWTGLRNSYLSNPNLKEKYTPEQAAAEASKDIWDKIGYNVYDQPKDKLFDANGKLTGKMKSQIVDDRNWFAPLERTGYRREYNVSADGANSKANYFISANYLGEDGYIISSGIQRFTARANGSIQPVKWLRVGLSLSGSHREGDYTSTGSNTGYINPFYFARNIAPIYPVYAHDLESADGAFLLDESGNKIYDWGQFDTRGQYSNRHIVLETMLNKDKYLKNQINTRANVDVMFLKDFKFSVVAGVDHSNSQERTYTNSTLGDGYGDHGKASVTEYRYQNITLTEMLSWNRAFDKHNVDAMVSHESYSSKYTYLKIAKTDEVFPEKYDLVNFNTVTSATDYENNYRLEGWLARAKYNYDNKYFFEGSFRRDGSSRFHKDHRWGNFWSVGGSWIISREPWMRNVSHIFDNLKLRASYGQVGNDQSVGLYAYMSLYSLTAKNAETTAAIKSQLDATDIQWESCNSFGVALEGRLFNRVNFSFEYFDKISKDLLFDVKLPVSAGITDTGDANPTQTVNLGNISNRGFEFNIDVDIIKNRDFQWNFGVNGTVLRNKILRLPEQNRENGIITGTKKYVEGGSIYDYWLYKWHGVDMHTGYSVYEIDWNNYYATDEKYNQPIDKKTGEPVERTVIPSEYVVTIAGKDYTTYTTYAGKDWAGSAIPSIYGSFNTALSYKGVRLSALFTWSLGGKTYDGTYATLMQYGLGSLHKNILGSWTEADKLAEDAPNRINPNALPVLDSYMSTYTHGASSNRWLHSSNYLVLKNVQISYSFPTKLINKIQLSGLALSLTAENLFTVTALTGMNPQYSFNGTISNDFITARTLSLGINVTL